jgi:hypothetical protein
MTSLRVLQIVISCEKSVQDMSVVYRQVWNIVIGITDDVKLIIPSQLPCYSGFLYLKYEVGSVNRLQMGIKSKTSYLNLEKKSIYFLTYPVPTLKYMF